MQKGNTNDHIEAWLDYQLLISITNGGTGIFLHIPQLPTHGTKKGATYDLNDLTNQITTQTKTRHK
jgi:hypothetical protein